MAGKRAVAQRCDPVKGRKESGSRFEPICLANRFRGWGFRLGFGVQSWGFVHRPATCPVWLQKGFTASWPGLYITEDSGGLSDILEVSRLSWHQSHVPVKKISLVTWAGNEFKLELIRCLSVSTHSKLTPSSLLLMQYSTHLRCLELEGKFQHERGSPSLPSLTSPAIPQAGMAQCWAREAVDLKKQNRNICNSLANPAPPTCPKKRQFLRHEMDCPLEISESFYCPRSLVQLEMACESIPATCLPQPYPGTPRLDGVWVRKLYPSQTNINPPNESLVTRTVVPGTFLRLHASFREGLLTDDAVDPALFLLVFFNPGYR